MTVLVNQFTASASEITAGALQDDGIGTLVGARTFGKGVMQTLTPLPDGAAIKITTAHYLTPSNRDINLRGIDPDVAVDENRDARFGDVDKDAQLRAASTLFKRRSLGLRGLVPAADSRTIVPLWANETSSINRRMKKMPKPRPRSSGWTLIWSEGAGKPGPPPWTATVSAEPSKLQSTMIRPDRVLVTCSTALLKASPAARRTSATASFGKPQSRAKSATASRAFATLRISLVIVAR